MSTATAGLLTTREACAYLAISRPTLYRWARAARINRIVRGKVVRWPRDELDKLKGRFTRQMR